VTQPPASPTATYRLQFNRDFTFADATHIIPYLHQLGISHIYASPYLKARAGSSHGYDIVDHNSLNPEIGDTASFADFVGALRQHGMGQILDTVPNHMGVGGDDNNWWLDVLENGEASFYAAYFDIDWHPVNPALHNKVLLPFLGDHYGTVLESGELQLSLDRESGAFGVHYHEHLFPIDPRTWPRILTLCLDEFSEQAEKKNEILALIETCRAIPLRTDLAQEKRTQRREAAVHCKEQLVQLCTGYPEIAESLERSVVRINGAPGEPHSFDMLHRLFEDQAYRLAYWQVASDEINYRRFFDINNLAGLSMEHDEVFRDTHCCIKRMIADGHIQGLRIDHPDGLHDPFKYFNDLQQMARESLGLDDNYRFYLLAEKILASHERLPDDWPVAGTTGYEAAYLLNGLFVYPGDENKIDRLYSRFGARHTDLDEILYERKQLIIHSALSSELNMLANLLNNIAEADRHTRDFTLHGLRDALGEIAASFPVYRSYITPERISEADRRHIHWAVVQAKRRNPAADILIFDFIHALLLPEQLGSRPSSLGRKVIQFAMRFQQYTSPVMAKAMEDTTFYIYNRLVSLNDVGFDPRIFGISPAAFHQENMQRLESRPDTMLSTSTHDSKRSEDVRARIDVLSEIADEWRRHLSRWSRLNRGKKRTYDDDRAPSRNDEYLLYQTLIGAWPLSLGPDQPDAMDQFRERIEAYMIKAVKEAKLHTSWINPNEDYEDAVRHFVHALLHDPQRNAFLADFIPFQQRVAHLGLYNSLSQTLLKLTMPGVPDIYQGNERWCFNLVDPDNRRPVDHSHNEQLLHELVQRSESGEDLLSLARELMKHIGDGRAKLYVTWRALNLRIQNPGLFQRGEYQGLTAEGPKSDHVCAFARRFENIEIIVAAARWFARLTDSDDNQPLNDSVWKDTWLEAPQYAEQQHYRDLFTNKMVVVERFQDGFYFHAADLFRELPVALLINEKDQF
jgi:(1->4)-alpha-D-glucan 1-alpha-D-glucosylmutase